MGRLMVRVAGRAAIVAAIFSGAAAAVEPGFYECRISSATVLAAGAPAAQALADAPEKFTLEIGEGPIFGDQLRETPLRTTDIYEPEPRAVMVARISAPLFANRPVTMRSSDRSSFAGADAGISVTDDGAFAAYGRKQYENTPGAAIYSGQCVLIRGTQN